MTLVLASLLCLGPFINKPVHLDDPPYLWAARQIQSNPLDPYGFQVSWGRTVQPMCDAMQNPPLTSYYIALVTFLFGWSEGVLHAAFLVPALAAILGTFELARRLCSQPLLAALATLLTPVFLVSATTLMSDVMMLAFWVWAVVLWERGLAAGRPGWHVVAATLVALAELTKYFAVCLIPLLALFALLRQRRLAAIMPLLIPIAVVAAYQWATVRLYGHGLFFAAGEYALSIGDRNQSHFVPRLIGILTFTGGCLAWPLFATPLFWRRSIWTLAGALALVAAVIFHFSMGYDVAHSFEASSAAMVGIQVALWTLGGTAVAGLAVADARRIGTPESWVLLCWIGGTLAFAGLINWTLNARSILPVLPAAAILMSRRLDWLAQNQGSAPLRKMRRALVASVLLGLAVARADCQWAAANRIAAETIHAKSSRVTGDLWFVGHWGFQHYMMNGRGKPFDMYRSVPQAGDLCIVPLNNSGTDVAQTHHARLLVRLRAAGPSWLATMSREVGAGFYSSVWGPLPFAFGRVPLEEFLVLQFPEAVPPLPLPQPK